MTTTSSRRAQKLAAEFEAAAEEFGSLVESLTLEEWALRGQNSPIWSLGADEERSVGVIAYHTASVIGIHTVMLREGLAGRPLLGDGRWTVDGVAEWNASVAGGKAAVTPVEVQGELRTNTVAALDLLRSLCDEDLDRRVTDSDRAALGPFHPQLETLGQFIQEGPIGHVRIHRESLRATLGR